MLAFIAVRLNIPMLNASCEIINNEHPDQSVGRDDIDFYGPSNPADVLKVVDCRVYSNFLQFHSLYSSTGFINVKLDADIQVKFNTICRVRDKLKLNAFRSFRHPEFSKQYKFSGYVHFEEEFFSHVCEKMET